MRCFLEKEFDFDPMDPLKRLLITDIIVQNPETGKKVSLKCLWDTGASGTCITPAVVRELALKPISAVVAQSANSSDRLGMYLVNIDLGPTAFNGLAVAGLVGIPGQVADVFLGMDVIGRGEMHLTHRKGKLVLHWE
jgi:predicted aspartyl protease